MDYDIEVSLDTSRKVLTGTVLIQYNNRSNKNLNKIFLHLWTNAYQSKASDFSKQNLASNDDKFYWADDKKMGGYQNISFYQDENELDFAYVQQNKEFVELSLNQSIGPNETGVLKVNFESKIPYIFSRGGWAKDFIALTQWFPKVAVYDKDEWHLMPYLEMGEYFSEYGDYKVTIETPDSSIIGATGVLVDSTVLDSGRVQRTYEAKKVLDFAWFYGHEMIAQHGKTVLDNGQTVDLHYYAPKNYPLNHAQVSDTLIPQVKGQINNNLSPIGLMARAVQFYSEEVAPYPYPQASVVIGPLNTGGGMEYPMITLVAPMRDIKMLDRTMTHEIGHNWFQSILGFNERQSPYLDEGINSFYEKKYMDRYYPEPFQSMQIMAARTELTMDQIMYHGSYQRGDILPVNSHTHDMSTIQYYYNGYMVPPTLFKKLEEVVGEEKFKAAMNEFYQNNAFGHPTIEDLRKVFEKDGQSLDWFFTDMLTTVKKYEVGIESVEERGDHFIVHLSQSGEIKAPAVLKVYDGPKVVLSYDIPSINDGTSIKIPIDDYDYFAIDQGLVIEETPHDNTYYFTPQREQKFLNPVLGLNNPGINKIWWYPIFNYNYSSGGILGAGLHNITLPGNNFEFNLHPGYALKSNEIVGMASMDYYIPKNNTKLRYINFGWSLKRYTFDYNEAQDFHLNYTRINPHFKISFQPKNAINPWYKTLRFEMPIVQEEIPVYNDEGFYDGNDGTWRYIPRGEFTIEKKSPVNNIKLNILTEFQSYKSFFDRSENYLKTSVELMTDYAYAPKKKIYARFFIGGFPVNSSRDIGSVASYYTQGSLAMFSQAYNDYAFDGYFLDRTERADNILSRQVRQNDGGFKDALGYSYANVTGNSNSFLASANLSFNLPFIPAKIPIQPYFDIGIYDDATPTGSGMEMLYSGGIMLGNPKWPIQVYLPLVYSEAIGNIYKERGNIWKRISFKMDLENFKLSEKARDTRVEDLNIFQ
ncbi:hypothetical protein GCM10025777_60560 [Membranihabitans marinus]